MVVIGLELIVLLYILVIYNFIYSCDFFLKYFRLSMGDSPVESSCIFDYKLVIERSQAYHGTNSGFSWVVEMCKIKVPKKYLHIYPPFNRVDNDTYPYGYYRTDWTVFR